MKKEELTVRKQAVRQEKIMQRRAITPEARTEKSERICRRLMETEAYERAKTLLLYHAMPGEVMLDLLAEDAKRRGKRAAYPLCISSKEMQARIPWTPDDYTSGAFGIREPDPARSDPVDPAEIDLAVVPCAAFDSACRRLGMGSGYYDRYLPKCCGAAVIAAAYEIQKCDRIPTDEYDQPVHKVITESAIYRKRIK